VDISCYVSCLRDIFISQIVGKFPRNFSGKVPLFSRKFPDISQLTKPIFSVVILLLGRESTSSRSSNVSSGIEVDVSCHHIQYFDIDKKHFSRSYRYTVWSAIGIIMSSVCLSVCNAVHCGARVGVRRWKFYRRVPRNRRQSYCYWFYQRNPFLQLTVVYILLRLS